MPSKKTNVRKLTEAIKEAMEQSIQEATAQLDADLKAAVLLIVAV